MFMAIYANPKRLPWLIAASALLLGAGLMVLLS